MLGNQRIQEQVSAVGDDGMQIRGQANRMDKGGCAATWSCVDEPKAAPSVIIWEPLAAREQPARGTEDTPPEVKHLALPVRSELNQFVPKG